MLAKRVFTNVTDINWIKEEDVFVFIIWIPHFVLQVGQNAIEIPFSEIRGKMPDTGLSS